MNIVVTDDEGNVAGEIDVIPAELDRLCWRPEARESLIRRLLYLLIKAENKAVCFTCGYDTYMSAAEVK